MNLTKCLSLNDLHDDSCDIKNNNKGIENKNIVKGFKNNNIKHP